MPNTRNNRDPEMFEWVEMLDAEWIGEQGKGTVFRFTIDGRDCWVATSRCKREGDKFYIEDWAARKNMREWNAEFVPGTQGNEEPAQMRAREINLPYDITDELRTLARRMLLLLRDSGDLT